MRLIKLLTISALFLLFFISAQKASAISAGDLKNLKVIGHHFTTRFTNGRRIVSIKNATDARYVVIKIAATAPSYDSKIFINDFVLQYLHKDGKEDRMPCSAICRAKTDELNEEDGCSMGTASWVKFTDYLTLVFYIENDVDSVNIGRVGSSKPLQYHIGSDRLFSVYISTNQGADKLKKIEKIIRAGGYQVTGAGTSLPEDQEGVVIHYAENAEVQAREISQRIMTEMSIAPQVKKSTLISGNDIVIWVGK